MIDYCFKQTDLALPHARKVLKLLVNPNKDVKFKLRKFQRLVIREKIKMRDLLGILEKKENDQSNKLCKGVVSKLLFVLTKIATVNEFHPQKKITKLEDFETNITLVKNEWQQVKPLLPNKTDSSEEEDDLFLDKLY
uniref:Uncharacterized protein n=1 Tax=Clastoptera arizonana TaxID=38151 RepID=A0A1B6DF70_9HEMI